MFDLTVAAIKSKPLITGSEQSVEVGAIPVIVSHSCNGLGMGMTMINDRATLSWHSVFSHPCCSVHDSLGNG